MKKITRSQDESECNEPPDAFENINTKSSFIPYGMKGLRCYLLRTNLDASSLKLLL